MIRLVVFDLDGTLVDSSVDIAESANAMIAEVGGRPLAGDAIVDMVGEGAARLVGRALRAASLDVDLHVALARFLTLYDARLLAHTAPYDGMVDALEEIGALASLAVLTNKPAAATDRLLAGLALRPYFRDAIGGDTTWGRKPSPAGLLHLAASAGAQPADTLLVGDSPIDLATARNAGTRICLARWGFGYKFTPADFRGDETFADRPHDLAAVVRRLNQ